MKAARKLLSAALAVLLCLSFFLFYENNKFTAFADSPAQQLSYKIELENGSKFFYMRGEESTEEDEEFLNLKSGLYYSDTLKNIYYIEPVIWQDKAYERYFYEDSIIISDDGLYFANLPWTSFVGNYYFDGEEWKVHVKGQGGPAIEFFENGVSVSQYYLTDLVEDLTQMQFSVSHVWWEDYRKREFDVSLNKLSVTTLDGINHVFDLTTGAEYNDIDALTKRNKELSETVAGLSEKVDAYGRIAKRNTVVIICLSVVVVVALSFNVIFLVFGRLRKQK